MIREATHDDVPRLVDLARVMHAEAPNFRDLPFDGDRLAATLRGLVNNPRGFAWLLEDEDGETVGALVALAVPHFFSPSLVSCDLGLFVLPERRGGMGVVRLLNAYRAWSHEIGATKVQIGLMTGVHVEHTRALLERLGWHCAGLVMEA